MELLALYFTVSLQCFFSVIRLVTFDNKYAIFLPILLLTLYERGVTQKMANSKYCEIYILSTYRTVHAPLYKQTTEIQDSNQHLPAFQKAVAH